jgi:SET domain-containing protein
MKTVANVRVEESGFGKGRGLFAGTDIAKGAFVAEYTGTKVSSKAADAMKSRYLFEIDDQWTIDAEHGGGVARYINHSCEPNTEAEIEDGHINIYAVKNISNGEEVTIDYGDEYYDEFIRPVGCKCGALKHH